MIPGVKSFGSACFANPGGVSWLASEPEATSAITNAQDAVFILPITESFTISESSSNLLTTLASASPEVIFATDTCVSLFAVFFFGTVGETSLISERVSTSQGALVVVDHFVNALDIQSNSVTSLRGASDTVVTADAASTFKGYAVSRDEAGSAINTVDSNLVTPQNRVELLTSLDVSSVLLGFWAFSSNGVTSNHLTESANSRVDFHMASADSLLGQDSMTGKFVSTQIRAEVGFANEQGSTGQVAAADRAETGSGVDTVSTLEIDNADRAETGSGVDTVSTLYGSSRTLAEILTAVETPSFTFVTSVARSEIGVALNLSTVSNAILSARVEAGAALDSSSRFVSVVVAEIGTLATTQSSFTTGSSLVIEDGGVFDTISYSTLIYKSQAEHLVAVATLTAKNVTAAASVEIGSVIDTVYGSKNGLANVLAGSVTETLAVLATIDAIRAYADLASATKAANSGTKVRIFLENGMSTLVSVDDIDLTPSWDVSSAVAGVTASIELGGLVTRDVAIDTNTETDVQLAQTLSPNYYKVTEVGDTDKAGAAVVGVKISDQKP